MKHVTAVSQGTCIFLNNFDLAGGRGGCRNAAVLQPAFLGCALGRVTTVVGTKILRYEDRT